MTLDEAIDTIKTRTRQYAKRQLTWFRADKRIKWIKIDGKTPIQIAKEIASLL
jgi:tRNA dimethylallyltransferase